MTWDLHGKSKECYDVYSFINIFYNKIFRISSIFNFSMKRTDNAAVSVYPFQDQIYAMTEVPVMYK